MLETERLMYTMRFSSCHTLFQFDLQARYWTYSILLWYILNWVTYIFSKCKFNRTIKTEVFEVTFVNVCVCVSEKTKVDCRICAELAVLNYYYVKEFTTIFRNWAKGVLLSGALDCSFSYLFFFFVLDKLCLDQLSPSDFNLYAFTLGSQFKSCHFVEFVLRVADFPLRAPCTLPLPPVSSLTSSCNSNASHSLSQSVS